MCPCDLVTLHLCPELKMVDKTCFSVIKSGKARRENGNGVSVTSERDNGNNMKEKRNACVTPVSQVDKRG